MTREFFVKVHDLLDTGSVRLGANGTAWVHGEHDWYRIEATEHGVQCTCRAAARGTCTHAAAAMVAWKERTETPFG